MVEPPKRKRICSCVTLTAGTANPWKRQNDLFRIITNIAKTDGYQANGDASSL
jgi:hypothetical protein